MHLFLIAIAITVVCVALLYVKIFRDVRRDTAANRALESAPSVEREAINELLPASTTAPTYFDNARGFACWSGKNVADLSPMDVIAILEFCESEGARQGWNAEIRSDPVGQTRNPFGTDFLEGRPARWWNANFEKGREKFRDDGSRLFEE